MLPPYSGRIDERIIAKDNRIMRYWNLIRILKIFKGSRKTLAF